MRVTEGKASRKERWLHLAIALVLPVLAASAFVYVPLLTAAVLWSAFAMAGGLVLRNWVFSLVARFIREEPSAEPVSRPSVTFVIPCLNELPSLRQTVPALTALEYEGELRFCYACESASTDGSLQYLKECAESDDRIVVLEKPTPPGGRGAAIVYGLAHAPPGDVVGLLDADHILPQSSLDELVRAFGREGPPEAVQGRCATSNASPHVLARTLTIEREWLERVELQVAPRLGGMTQFGGGQGFFLRSLLDDERFAVDPSMVLDDTDLSCRLVLSGHRVEFNPGVVTESRQPDTLSQFFDQRIRWEQGWMQVAAKHLLRPFRAAKASLSVRLDMVRLLLTPFGGAWLWLGLVAGTVALAPGGARHVPAWLPYACLLWPWALGPGPLLAGVARLGDAALALLGWPLLAYVYCWIAAVSVVHVYVLRRPLGYAKTAKEERA